MSISAFCSDLFFSSFFHCVIFYSLYILFFSLCISPIVLSFSFCFFSFLCRYFIFFFYWPSHIASLLLMYSLYSSMIPFLLSLYLSFSDNSSYPISLYYFFFCVHLNCSFSFDCTSLFDFILTLPSTFFHCLSCPFFFLQNFTSFLSSVIRYFLLFTLSIFSSPPLFVIPSRLFSLILLLCPYLFLF